jgi:hypothetical protein
MPRDASSGGARLRRTQRGAEQLRRGLRACDDPAPTGGWPQARKSSPQALDLQLVNAYGAGNVPEPMLTEVLERDSRQVVFVVFEKGRCRLRDEDLSP